MPNWSYYHTSNWDLLPLESYKKLRKICATSLSLTYAVRLSLLCEATQHASMNVPISQHGLVAMGGIQKLMGLQLEGAQYALT